MAAVSVSAQAPTAVILGTVKDTQGGTVAGATVTVTSPDTGLSRSQPSGDDGSYRFNALPVGNWNVSIMKDGFQTYQRTGLNVVVDQQAVVDVVLQVGTSTQTVTVTGEAPVVNTTTATLGGVLDEVKVEDLPLNGRNFVDLTLLQPGVTQTSIVTGPYGMGGTMYSSNGATLRSNMTTIDGANMTTLMGLSSTSAIFTTLGIDGIKEYKVITNMFSAEYGLATGSQSVIVSKGGANQWHGDAFEYLRNSVLDANNFFNTVDYANARGFACNSAGNKLLAYPCDRIPPYKRNNFGGSFGGAIKKDKMFFYGVYEGLREKLSPVTTASTLPIGCYVDAATDTLNVNLATGLGTLPLVIDNSPLTNPWTTNIGGTKTACSKPINFTSGPNTGTQANPTLQLGSGNAVAEAQIRQFSNLFPFPLPGLGGVTSLTKPTTQLTDPVGFNYQFPFTQPSREDYEQLRLDDNISAKDTAFLRYTVDWSNQFPNGSYADWYSQNRSLSAIGTAAETRIVSATVLNRVSLSYSRTDLNLQAKTYTGPNGSGTNPNPLGVLIPGREDATGLSPGSGTLTITGHGTGGQSPNNTTGNTNGNISQNIWGFSDDVFWNKGKHAFKFGTLINHYTGLFRINFTYEGSLSFSTLDNFFQDQYSSAQAPSIGGGGAPIPAYIQNCQNGVGGLCSPQGREYWWNTMGFYVQDDYRVLPRVTLNLGLRYEFMTLPQSPAGLAYSVLDPSVQVPCTIPVNQFGCAGPANGQGTPETLWGVNNSKHNFSPRIGFAWDVFGDGKMAIRGGGAIMYDIADLGTSIAGNASGDPSLSALETISVSGYPTLAGSTYTPPGLPAIPLSFAGQNGNTPQCSGVFQFTPTCPAFSFQNLGAFPCTDGSIFLPGPCPAGEKVTTALTARVADYKMQQPTMGEWSLTLDRQLPFAMDLTVSYVGTKGWHVMQTTESNPTLAAGIGANGLPFYCTTTAGVAVEATAATKCIANVNNNRINPNLGATQFYTAGGDSYYQGLQTALNKRLSNGLSLQLSYTYSKSIDDGEKANSDGGSGALSGQTVCSGILGVENVAGLNNPATGAQATTGLTSVPCTLGVDRGPAFFNDTHNLRVNAIYHIPDIKTDRFYGGFLHGWWISDITSWQTGFPINIVDGTDRSGTSNQNTSGSRPNLDASYNPGTVVTGNPNGWFNTTMFDLNPAGTFGNAPRNSVEGPHLSNSNISINKDTRLKWLGEAGNLELRVEMFNAFNHPSFLQPSGSIGVSSSSAALNQPSAATGNPNGQFKDTRALFAAGSPANGPSASGSSGVITALSGVGNREIQLSAKIIF